MRRYQLALGGTIAGIAGVLAFPVHSTHLTALSSATGSTTTNSGGTASSSTSSSTSTTSAPANSSSASSGSTTTTSTASSTKTATSADETFRYGDLAVTVTVNGSKITHVVVASLNETDGRSASIDRYAIPQLEQQVISANSVNVNGVSGATFTSQAFVNAVSSALGKLGITS